MIMSDCLLVTQTNDKFIHETFTQTTENYWKQRPTRPVRVDTFSYSIFAGYSDFQSLIPNTNFTARELRGLTFVTEDCSPHLTERYWGLSKFHNLNETIGYMQPELEKLEYIGSSEKYDGSCIIYVNINGTWMPKTGRYFSGEAIDNCPPMDEHLNRFLEACYGEEIQPIFEVISPNHKLVVDNKESALCLLWYREMHTGKYLQPENAPPYIRGFASKASIKESFYQPLADTLEEVFDLTSNMKNSEGCVHVFKDNNELRLVKQKSLWYLSMQGIKLAKKQQLTIHNLINLWLLDSLDDAFSFITDNEVLKQANQFREYMKNYMDLVEETSNFALRSSSNSKELNSTIRKYPELFIHKDTLHKHFSGKDLYIPLTKKLRNDLKSLSKKKANEWWNQVCEH